MKEVSRGFWMIILAITLNGLMSCQASSQTKPKASANACCHSGRRTGPA